MANQDGVISLELVDGTKVVVLDSLDYINSHELCELADWFEVPVNMRFHCLDCVGWMLVDRLKIDVDDEGDHRPRGGARFFQERCPLVMVEVMAGVKLEWESIRRSVSLGDPGFYLMA